MEKRNLNAQFYYPIWISTWRRIKESSRIMRDNKRSQLKTGFNQQAIPRLACSESKRRWGTSCFFFFFFFCKSTSAIRKTRQTVRSNWPVASWRTHGVAALKPSRSPYLHEKFLTSKRNGNGPFIIQSIVVCGPSAPPQTDLPLISTVNASTQFIILITRASLTPPRRKLHGMHVRRTLPRKTFN